MKLITFLLTLSLACSTVVAQTGKSKELGDEEFTKASFEKIKTKASLSDPDKVFQSDKKIILKALNGKDYKSLYEKRGVKDAEIRPTVYWLWYSLRVGDTAVPGEKDITDDILKTRLMAWAKLVLESEPAGAMIKLDGDERDVTDSVIWCSPGKRRIQLIKSGYKEIDEMIDAKRNAETTFKRTLEKKKD